MLAWRTSRSEEIARSACPGLDPGAIRCIGALQVFLIRVGANL